MFQQFFCCSYSVINHLAGSEHMQDTEGSSFSDVQQSFCTLLRGSHSYWQMWAAKKKKKRKISNWIQDQWLGNKWSCLKQGPWDRCILQRLFHWFARTAFGHRFQTKEFLIYKNTYPALHKRLVRYAAAWSHWEKALKSFIQPALVTKSGDGHSNLNSQNVPCEVLKNPTPFADSLFLWLRSWDRRALEARQLFPWACNTNLGQRDADVASPVPCSQLARRPAWPRASCSEMRDTGTLLCLSCLNLGLGFHSDTSAVDFLLVLISKGCPGLWGACRNLLWSKSCTDFWLWLQQQTVGRIRGG